MKTKKLFLLLLLFVCTATLFAQKITREKADEIVINYLKNNLNGEFFLHVNSDIPNKDGFSMTTVNGETIKVKYACWVYYARLAVRDCGRCISPRQQYLFVKEDNGSLLEVFTNEDDPQDVSSWIYVKVPQGIVATTTTAAQAVGYYNLMGIKLPQEPTSGIYIIVYDNGTAKKMLK